jgi:dienelactone hydrolase
MVYISPGMNGGNGMPGGWRKDFQSRNLIWIGAKNGGNNHPGVRRVWLAQQARAWALHHYKIDTSRMIISGFSNGGDAASATAVATPFGFNNAILFAPPCNPPLGTVTVPQEKDAQGTPVNFIKPLSSGGISNIKKNWRIAYVCGSKDNFLAEVKRSAEAVKGLDSGSKLFEIDGLGHGVPGDISNIFDFIFSPREAANDKGASRAFNVDPVLSSIRSQMKTQPAKARESMLQLWNNHPEVRATEEVAALIAEMEALP